MLHYRLGNMLESLIAVLAGAIAGSISLVGFGVDSFIEVTSGATLLWRMSVDAEEHRRERIEQLTLRIVGACFLIGIDDGPIGSITFTILSCRGRPLLVCRLLQPSPTQSLQCAGVERKYSNRTSVIARMPMGIDESSATKFVAWLIAEVVPGFCVPSAKKNAGATCAK
jgi:hypothetical protein